MDIFTLKEIEINESKKWVYSHKNQHNTQKIDGSDEVFEIAKKTIIQYKKKLDEAVKENNNINKIFSENSQTLYKCLLYRINTSMFSFFKKKECKLTTMQELLLALLRAQLWLKPVDDIVLPSTMDDWNELMDMAYKQTVVCFISAACLRHKDVDNIPTDIREEMESVIEENKKIHKHHNAILIELISKFEEQGLHPILLKGQGIAQMYPEPELRQCGDIDLYFLPDEYEKAKVLVLSFDSGAKHEKETYKHFGTSYKGIDVELHRHTCNFPNPFVNKKFQKWTDEVMKSPSCIRISDKDVPIPSPIYGIVSTFAHMWHHFENGDVSLRQLCDVLVLYKYWHKNGDLSCLNSSLKTYDLLQYWQITSCLLNIKFGMFIDRSKANSFLGKASIMMSFVMNEGGFRHEKKNCKLKSTKIERCFYTHKSRWNLFIKYYSVSGFQFLWRYAIREHFYPYFWLKYFVEHC